MDSLMFNQVWALAKTFTTMTALIGFFSCMDSLMYNKIRALTEGFPTFITFVRFFTSVDSLMFNKVWAPTETFNAPITRIGLLPSMNSLMQNQGWAHIKGLSTLITFIGFLPVGSSMPNKACTTSKALPTFITVVLSSFKEVLILFTEFIPKSKEFSAFRILENIISGVARLFSQWFNFCCNFLLGSHLSNTGLSHTIWQVFLRLITELSLHRQQLDMTSQGATEELPFPQWAFLVHIEVWGLEATGHHWTWKGIIAETEDIISETRPAKTFSSSADSCGCIQASGFHLLPKFLMFIQ